MIIIDEDFNMVVAEASWNKVKLAKEQIQILKSWINPEPEVKSKLPTGGAQYPVHARFTRTNPASGFSQKLMCTLFYEDSTITGLECFEQDPYFYPSMFKLCNGELYKVQAVQVQPYQDTVYPKVHYAVYTLTLVDDPKGYRFIKVLSIGEPTDDPFGDDEDYGEEYPCK
jgi:hypothetical protein